MLNKCVINFSKFSPLAIVFLTTLFVLLGSVPSVYLVTKLYGVAYENIHLVLSVVLPMLLTPPVILMFIKLSKHLKNFQDELEIEIEKNKKKDLMLFEQARFVLMGEMLANISHQWKQPLNTIALSIVNTKFLDPQNREGFEKNFDVMEKHISYLASTIDDFMSFFNKENSTQVRTLQSILKEVRTIIDMEISAKNISLEIEIEKEKGEILLASSISQVLLNLLNNAKDAFDDNMTDKKISLKFIAKEDSLEIACCDNGRGMSAQIKDKIFDPYFTTKDKTQGTGIGLYMSKQIVQKIFAGKITCELEPVCFYIKMPYTDKCLLQEGTK